MTDNDSQPPAPTPIDPRLKSFLRQATAIITAEKGLNSASRVKLESLAKHVKLPQDLFDEALVRLQSNDTLKLTHYERAFIKFLDAEFAKIKGGVISLGMELEAIDLAEKKYQINSTRAEQLIKARAQAAGISRISPAEAAVFAERIIVERVNTLASVDDELRNDLYRIGKKWGYQRKQVDRVIFRELSLNRAQKRTAILKRSVFLLSLALLAGLATALATGRIPIGPFSQSSPTPPTSNPDQHAQDNDIQSDQPSEQSTFSQLEKFAQNDRAIKPILKTIAHSDASKRKAGFEDLTGIACSDQRYDRSELLGLISKFYYEEQSDVAASGILSAIKNNLPTQSPAIGVSINELKNTYRANRMLGQVCFSGIAKHHESSSRHRSALTVVKNSIKIPITEAQSLADYLKRSESAIAVDHWNLLNQTIWSPSPVDAAVLYGPILSLTKPKLDAETLNSYRDETLISLIEVDASEWNYLKEPIRETISRCQEIKLNRWISAFVKTNNTAMQDFLAPLLLKRIDVKPKSVVRKDVFEAIANYESTLRNRLIEPVTTRDTQLTQAVETFLQNQTNSPSEITPDRIASVALAVNAQMAFCAALENVTHIDDSSFVQFDRLNQSAASGPLRLREVISLPIDRRTEQTSSERNSATSSDKARKAAAIERLSLLGKDSTGARKLALNQLAKVAPRFQRLSYRESDTLAAYLLSDLGTEELLNAQVRIEAFSHWPNLILAIADKLPASGVGIDQALTVARLLLGQDFDFRQSDSNWQQELQSHLYRTISTQISNQVDLDPNNIKSDWNRLRIYLNDAYRDRLMIVNKADFLARSFAGPDQVFLELTLALASQNSRGIDSNLEKSKTIVDQSSDNEITRTVLAGQFLIELISNELKSTNVAGQARNLASQFQSNMRKHSFVGEQLYQTELVLLRLFSLKRQLLVKQLQERS